jgi:CheY-like chemotaxis protein
VASRLLLADDSVTIQRVIELTFADEQVDVVAVGDGREAIERIQADPPDIVLADIGMPERDGYEVAAFMKGQPHLAHIPVVLLTGAFEPIDEARARAVGCDAVLVKPFEPQMVISRVRDLLSARRLPAPAEGPLGAAPATASTTTQRGAPHPAAAARVPAGGLDDYFDRLDAALVSLASTSAAGPPAVARDRDTAAAGDEHSDRPEAEAVHDVGTSSPSVPTGSTAMSDAFAALLAAEEGHAVASAPRAVTAVSEELIEEIVRRVIARLGDHDMRRLVLDRAERLVREEIDRIKAR